MHRLLRLGKYWSVDVATFALNMGAFWLLVRAGIPYPQAIVVGFFAQLVAAFFINRVWTFHTRTSAIYGLPMTTLANLAVLGIALGGTAVGVEVAGLSPLVARLCVGVVAGLVGFVLDSFFTFRINPFH